MLVLEMKSTSQFHSSLFCMSPKNLTGEPLYSLLNQIQINHEVKREAWDQVKTNRAQGTRCQTLARLGKTLSALLTYKLQNRKGLACQNIFTPKGDSLPNPQEIQIWILRIDNASEPNHPSTPENDTDLRKIPTLSWKRLLLKRKCSEWNSDSIQFSKKIRGRGGSISQFLSETLSLPLRQCCNIGN